jgi:rhodanese-related sulfurtransferase
LNPWNGRKSVAFLALINGGVAMWRHGLGVFLAVFGAILFLGLDAGTSESSADPQGKSPVSQFEIIRAAADAYAQSGELSEVTAKQLYQNLTDGKEANDPLILNVYEPNSELPNVYAKGHIPGAVKIPWGLALSEKEFLVLRGGYAREGYMTKLPKDKQIVVYSYNGHLGDQLATLLKLVGYDAKNLKWGITSWTRDKAVAPGRYEQSQDCTAQRVDDTTNEATGQFALPVVRNTASGDPREIIRAAAEAFAKSGKDVTISADDLFNRQRDHNPANRPLILNVDDVAVYSKGHIFGAVNIPYKVLFKSDNLRKLNNKKQIVVYSHDGHAGNQATALLNILGYDAMSLKWGLASWTCRKDLTADRYDESKDCLDYVLATGPLPLGEQSYY